MRPFQVTVARNAAKEIEALPSHLKPKIEEMRRALETSSNPRDWPQNWQAERIVMREINSDGPIYSVRLNHGYRLVFSIDGKGNVVVHAVSKTLTHNN